MGNNEWFNHVKKYAAEHNVSYACALSHPDCKNSYTKLTKPPKKEKQEQQEQQTQDILKSIAAALIGKIKSSLNNEQELTFLRSSFQKKSKKFQEYFIKNYPNAYKKLGFD